MVFKTKLFLFILIVMILIVSEITDDSTSEVIDWLLRFNQKFIRINENDRIEIEAVDINDKPEIVLTIKDEKISTNNINSYWFRRGGFYSKLNINISNIDEGVRDTVKKHLNNELATLTTYLYHFIEQKHHLGNKLTDDVNKLFCLLKAHELGLRIPRTQITKTKKDIINSNPIVSKGIHSVACFNLGTMYLGNYTEEVQAKDIEESEEFFFPSLFQEKLDKKYELRLFFLDGIFYTTCIFSQLDPKTATDFRKYNLKKPNRVVPYTLPSEVYNKLQMLMSFFKLKTASIDMVVTKDDEFIFLEINPVGQFGMVSYACNYHLEMKIASYLIRYEE